jgi:hypothetical protein
MAWRFDDPYCDIPPPYRQTFNPGFSPGYSGGGWGRNPLKRIRKAKRFYEDLEKEWDVKKKVNTKPTASRFELWIITIFFIAPVVGFTALALGSWLLKLTFLNLKAIGAP